MTFMSGDGPYTGAIRHASDHPFHCWVLYSRHTDEQFLSGNDRFDEKAEKTLEWSTKSSGMLKLDGFENRMFLSFREDWMHIRAHLAHS